MTGIELGGGAAAAPSHRPGSDRPGDPDPDQLLSAPQVAKLLGLNGRNAGTTVLNYAKRPGNYFPAPDEEETTPQGRVRRYWKRSTITTWDQGRAAGNRQPNTKVTAPAPPMRWQDVGEHETVTSGQAAAILGYADVGSFTSAYGQGNLAGLGDPEAKGTTGAAKTPTRLWSKRRVLREAEARWLRASQLQERQRLCADNLRSAQPLSAAKLHVAHPDLGTPEQWRSALNAARRAALKADTG